MNPIDEALINRARAAQFNAPGHATDIDRVQYLCDLIVTLANRLERYAKQDEEDRSHAANRE